MCVAETKRSTPLCTALLQLINEGGIRTNQRLWNDGKPQIIQLSQLGKVSLSPWVGSPVPTQLPETLLPIVIQRTFVLSPSSPLSVHPSNGGIHLWWPECPITLHRPSALLLRSFWWPTHAEAFQCLLHLNLYDLLTMHWGFFLRKPFMERLRKHTSHQHDKNVQLAVITRIFNCCLQIWTDPLPTAKIALIQKACSCLGWSHGGFRVCLLHFSCYS